MRAGLGKEQGWFRGCWDSGLGFCRSCGGRAEPQLARTVFGKVSAARREPGQLLAPFFIFIYAVNCAFCVVLQYQCVLCGGTSL